jgi:cyclic pyranopterin phosphate synthase
MPEVGVPASPKAEVLSIEELARIARVFHQLGVCTIRLTGGEPLVRRGIPTLVRLIRDEARISDIAMTTNGTALAHVAHDLVAAGLARANVSLDSIRRDTFRTMTRGGDLDRVIDGIDAVRLAGISELKINAVVVRGMNHDQLPEIVEWAWARGITPRFIELMPLGEGARLGRDAVVSVAEMKERLGGLIDREQSPQHRADRGPAGYLPSRSDPAHRVGFIGAVTDNFCHRCNRVRLTAKGEVRACLASPTGLSLRDLIRSGSDDEAIAHRVKETLYGKGAGHEFYVAGVDRHHAVDMSRIGG